MRADEEKRAKRLEAERQAKYDELNNPEQMSWASALFCGLYDPMTLGTPQPGNAPKRLEAYRGKSLKIFSRDNPIRKACFALCDDHRFDAVVMAAKCRWVTGTSTGLLRSPNAHPIPQ